MYHHNDFVVHHNDFVVHHNRRCGAPQTMVHHNRRYGAPQLFWCTTSPIVVHHIRRSILSPANDVFKHESFCDSSLNFQLGVSPSISFDGLWWATTKSGMSLGYKILGSKSLGIVFVLVQIVTSRFNVVAGKGLKGRQRNLTFRKPRNIVESN